jgi:hypothetical protein
MTIKYKKEKVYGRDVFYIIDPKIQKTYQILTSKKTLTLESMKALEELGMKFEQVLN